MRGQGKRRSDDFTRLRPGAAQIRDRDQEFESRSLRRRVNDSPIADSAVWVSMATCRTTRPFPRHATAGSGTPIFSSRSPASTTATGSRRRSPGSPGFAAPPGCRDRGSRPTAGGLRADPPLQSQEAGHTLPFGNVLAVVPIIELVVGHTRKIHCRDQCTFRHGRPSSSGNRHIPTPNKLSCAFRESEFRDDGLELIGCPAPAVVEAHLLVGFAVDDCPMAHPRGVPRLAVLILEVTITVMNGFCEGCQASVYASVKTRRSCSTTSR